MQQSLSCHDRANVILKDVELCTDVLMRVTSPQLVICVRVAHGWEKNLLDDSRRVWLKHLPRERVSNGLIDVIKSLLQDTGRDVNLAAVLIQSTHHHLQRYKKKIS